MLSERLRVVQKFWLDVLKPEERDLSKYIEHLKAERQFLPTIRDGLRLIRDLRAGNVDVLCELFPWVADKFKSQDSKLYGQLDRLERMLKEQGATPIAMRPKPALADDDTQLIEVNSTPTKRDNNSGWNMIIAATLQNLGHCNALGADIRAYGVRTNRIPKGALSADNWQAAKAYSPDATGQKPDKKQTPAAPKAISFTLKSSGLDDDDGLDLGDLL